MKKILVLTCLLLANAAIAQQWTPTNGKVTFAIKMLGATVNGSLTGMKANLKFADDDPVSLSATVATKTVNTQNSLRDKHLREKEEFFQSDKYPVVSMSSTNIKKVSDGKYVGDFNITIKNVTKSVSVPFTFTKTDSNNGTFKANFTIDRQNWNFGGSTPGMSDDVKVGISLTVVKK